MKPPSTLANRPNGQSRSQTSAPDNCLPPSPHRNKNIDRLGTGRLKRSNAPSKPKAQTSANERHRASSAIGRDARRARSRNWHLPSCALPARPEREQPNLWRPSRAKRDDERQVGTQLAEKGKAQSSTTGKAAITTR